MSERSYKGVRRVALIGSGDLMVVAADRLNRDGYTVSALLAPRHADEALPLTGGILRVRLEDAGAMVKVVENVNDTSSWPAEQFAGTAALALCFGPAWMFSTAVIGRFGFGMINVNLIPVPRYLGGAHYTWQILNGNRDGGCYLQDITADLDRGDILQYETFQVPESARVPEDYFLANFEHGQQCLSAFLRAMRDGAPLRPISYQSVNSDRLYFPRVMTLEQAFIDWRWSADEIVRFCNAFDRPYAGAATFCNGLLVRLKNVELLKNADDFHPFAAGIIVRRIGHELVVAARGGALSLGMVQDASGTDVRPRLREGRRLLTPAAKLEHAFAFQPRLSAQGFNVPREN